MNKYKTWDRLKEPPEIDEDGSKVWRDKEGRLHRENGPAIIWKDGSMFWYKNGKLHRENGPASQYANGTNYWWVNGKQVSEDEFNAISH